MFLLLENPSKIGHKTRFAIERCGFVNVKTTKNKENTTKNQKNKEKTY